MESNCHFMQVQKWGDTGSNRPNKNKAPNWFLNWTRDYGTIYLVSINRKIHPTPLWDGEIFILSLINKPYNTHSSSFQPQPLAPSRNFLNLSSSL